MGKVTERGFTARLDCHYLLRTPEVVDSRTPLVVTLHGFGADPESMLGLTARLFSTEPVIASVQGPFQFFRDGATREVGYGWVTNKHPAESIRLHHDMVSYVAGEVGREFGIPQERRLLAGFSQAVSLNYRFAAAFPEAVRGVIAICGGLPSDWESADGSVSAAILHIARRQDRYYPPNVTETYPERLRRRAGDVEFHLLDGGHQIPSGGSTIVGPWLERILPQEHGV
jgi:phospholipase/carboxylesterase